MAITPEVPDNEPVLAAIESLGAAVTACCAHLVDDLADIRTRIDALNCPPPVACDCGPLEAEIAALRAALTEAEQRLMNGGPITPPTTGECCVEAVEPFRASDSRADGIGRFAAGEMRSKLILSPTDFPVMPKAAWLNFTVTGPTAGGYLVVGKGSQPLPATSNLNWGSGETTANLALVQISAGGSIDVKNVSLGTTHLAIDVQGVIW